jgi:hypothetical protein
VTYHLAVPTLRRLIAVFVILGTLLSLSACSTTSVSSVTSSYKATFVATPQPGPMSGFFAVSNNVFHLVLYGNGRFVMVSSDRTGTTFKGTWNQSKDVLTLNSRNNQFVALRKGRNLRDGRVGYLGRSPPTGYVVTWSAVRT